MIQLAGIQRGTKEVTVIHMEEQLLTVKEVAEHIRKRPFTVRRYLRDGVIPAIKMDDGTWLVRASDVDAFLKKRMRNKTENER